MSALIDILRGLHRDQGGQATVEWVLVLVAFVIPTVAVLRVLLSTLVAHYQMVTFLETLPFP